MAGIYIHIPFCRQKCSYCDFYSVAYLGRMDEYIECIANEILIRSNYLSYNTINSIYFGGGTPSLLNHGHFDTIISSIKRYHVIHPESEVTLEANPDDINEQFLVLIKECGINRISLGIQSFDNDILKLLRRRHDAYQSVKAINLIKEAGFKNISIDLIYGIPGMNNKMWIDILDTAISSDIPHISAYHLTIEPKTLLYKMKNAGKLTMPAEEDSEKQFIILNEKLEKAGFEQYEISNFARNGLYSVHNSGYWKNVSYLGLGAAAHSYNGKSRQWNVCSINEYIDSVRKGYMPFTEEFLTLADRYNEYLMTSLRTKWGVDMGYVKRHFGEDYYLNFQKKAWPYLDSGKLLMKENVIFLSKQTQLISDTVLVDLFI